MAALRRKSTPKDKMTPWLTQQQDFENRLFPGTARKDRHHNEKRGRQTGMKATSGDQKNRIKSKSMRKNSSSSRDKQKKRQYLNKFPYLYDNKQSHPIIEFKPSKEETDSNSVTPSFVLEVTWPRIIQFYHPSSPHCTEFQPTYVSIARRIKHMSSRLPVEFHAVNCAKYREVCEYGFNIKSVPAIIGLKSGRIDWIELGQLLSDMDLDELSRYAANSLDVVLDEQKENTVAADNAAIENHMEKKVDVSITNINPLFDEMNEASTTESIPSMPESEHVFHDALSSFIITLTTSVYSHLPHGSALPPGRSIALREFIDLIRWAFPPETQLNVLAQALADEFFDVSTSEAKLLNVVGRYTNVNDGVIWSTGCSSLDSAQDGYTCGLWALLHILSVGVTERHDAVVGDVERLSVTYAGNVIRSFIDQFFIHCETCKHLWLSLYDELCCELHNSDSSIADKITYNEDQDRRKLALWIWEIHNEITVRRKHATGKSHNNKSSDLLWPSSRDCPRCLKSSMSNHRGRVSSKNAYNHDEMYTYLKHVYWSRGVHNNRHVLIDKWTAAKRHLSMQHLRERMQSNSGLKLNAFLLLLCVMWLMIACFKHRVGGPTSKRKLKAHHYDNDIVVNRSIERNNHMHHSNQLSSRRSKQPKRQCISEDFRNYCKTKDTSKMSSSDRRRYGSRHYQL